MNMKTRDTSKDLMNVNHYPGSSVPKMGEALRSDPEMPDQKPLKSFKGSEPGSKSPAEYDYRKDACEG